MLRYMLLGEAAAGSHRTDPHRYAEIMCGWSARFRRFGRAFR